MEWVGNIDCEHVPLTLPIALLLLLFRLRNATADHMRLQPAGAILLLLSSCCFAGDWLIEEPLLLSIGIWSGGLSLLLYLYRKPSRDGLLFPFLLLAFSFPPPRFILQFFVHGILQRWNAFAASNVLNLFGYSAIASGTVVDIEGSLLNIVEACSGFRFLLAMLFFSLVAGERSTPESLPGRIALVALAVPLAFLANLARLTAGGVLLKTAGPQAADQFLHGWSILLGYAGAMVVFVLAARTIAEFFRTPENAREITA